MYCVESLPRSRHSVGSGSDTNKEEAEVTDKEKEKERGRVENPNFFPSKVSSKVIIQSEEIVTQSDETDETDEEKENEREQCSRIHFDEDFEAAIQSEVKATKRKSK
jgi:hypothetical protein